MSEIKLAVSQFSAGRSVEDNLIACSEIIRAAGNQCDIVVLPENSMYSDPTNQNSGNSHHERIDGEFISKLCSVVKSVGVHAVVGMAESNGESLPYNTLVHIDSDGSVAGFYRKVHLYDAFGYKESHRVQSAAIDEPYITQLNGVNVGLLTCYDLRFPEASRWLVDAGADVIVLPAAWAVGPVKEHHWETLIRARAIENTIYFAGAGQTGPHCTGQSLIADPMGMIIANAGERSQRFAVATISKARIEEVRETNPSLANRRFRVVALG